MNRVGFFLLFPLLLAGCFTIGRDFDSTNVAGWIKSGDTAKPQVLEKLGNPFRVGMDAGDPTWSYGFYQYRVFGASDNKDLVIRFDAAGKVKSYTLNTTYPEEQRALDPAVK